jgi:DNA-directed RNA polymerase specialized sigma24 family protein
MSPLPAAVPPLSLWERLLARDASAWSELFTLFYEPLIAWLGRRMRYADPHLIEEAAETALFALGANPHSYDPRRASLESYLRLSARDDLLNLLRRERRHRLKRCELRLVEDGVEAGKYPGREDDPSWDLRLAEESERLLRPPHGLSDGERRVWELMQCGERATSVCAAALGLSHLPPAEQQARVKKVKDKITKRLERAGGES